MTNSNEVPLKLTVSQLLFPELLTTETLKSLLKDRCIRLKKMDQLSRERLLEIVHRVAVPLPQRPRAGIEAEKIDDVTTRLGLKNKESSGKHDVINSERKKIRINSSESGNNIRNSTEPINLKRKSTEDSITDDAKKNRVKITWP